MDRFNTPLDQYFSEPEGARLAECSDEDERFGYVWTIEGDFKKMPVVLPEDDYKRRRRDWERVEKDRLHQRAEAARIEREAARIERKERERLAYLKSLCRCLKHHVLCDRMYRGKLRCPICVGKQRGRYYGSARTERPRMTQAEREHERAREYESLNLCLKHHIPRDEMYRGWQCCSICLEERKRERKRKKQIELDKARTRAMLTAYKGETL